MKPLELGTIRDALAVELPAGFVGRSDASGRLVAKAGKSLVGKPPVR